MPGIDFERYEPLRGSMVTDAGWDALIAFIEEPQDIVVVDEAFTRDCELEWASTESLTTTVEGFGRKFEERPQLAQLVTFLGEVSALAVSDNATSVVEWNTDAKSMLSHVDVDQGHSILGYFGVEMSPDGSNPYLIAQTERTTDGSLTEVLTSGIAPALAPFVINPAPERTLLTSRQLVLLNGAAAKGTLEGVKCRLSVPHAVVVPQEAKRSRLMVYMV